MMHDLHLARVYLHCGLLSCRSQQILRALTVAVVIATTLLSTKSVQAFRVFHPEAFGLGILRWDAAPHFVDGVERSLDGGLRYSVQGGSYEAYRDLFQWEGTTPEVPDFQIAVEEAFGNWEAIDPATGLGTDLRFVPDFDTPVFALPVPVLLEEYFALNPGAEIDLLAEGLGPTIGGQVDPFADPSAVSVTLTSGVSGYAATVMAGSDLRMSTDRVWDIENFRRVLSHEIGHAIGLSDVDFAANPDAAISRFYDDNYDNTNSATARATLTNAFAHLIDPLDPDNSPALDLYDICELTDPNDGYSCTGDPGIDSPGVAIHMESDPSGQPAIGPQNDDFAGRQFLYPYVVPEPSSLLLAGLAGLLFCTRRR